MRKRTLFSSLMLPALVALLLLPPLSCMIFQHTAIRSAYSQAQEDLDALSQSILPMIEAAFRTTKKKGARDDVLGFLRKVSTAVRKANGNADVIILESQLNVVFPREEEERTALADFSALCIANLPAENEQEMVAELTDGNGEKFLVQYYRLPIESERIRYLIAYCSVSRLDAWVAQASVQVLLISAGFVVLVSIVLFFAIRGVSRPLKRLSDGVANIGAGTFVQIERPFSLRELEEVRLAVNSMSQRLQASEQNQRNFLQNVSHELRNPLMSIGGYAQGIERGVFASPQAAAHTIMEESQRLTELVGELLTLSRLENDTQAPSLEKLLVMEPIQDCMDRANGLAMQRNIQLVLQPFHHAICLLANEELLCQVLDNLLSNAIRYAKSTVMLTVEPVEQSVAICVMDDGEGIAQKDLPHLFERCYKGKGGHFGIGLAIAACSAEKLNGTLSASNRETGGACFTLRLPATR